MSYANSILIHFWCNLFVITSVSGHHCVGSQTGSFYSFKGQIKIGRQQAHQISNVVNAWELHLPVNQDSLDAFFNGLLSMKTQLVIQNIRLRADTR